MNHTMLASFEEEGWNETVISCVDVRIEYRISGGRPAKIHAPAEDCHPAEYAEIDVLEIWEEGSDGKYTKASDELYEYVICKIDGGFDENLITHAIEDMNDAE